MGSRGRLSHALDRTDYGCVRSRARGSKDCPGSSFLFFFFLLLMNGHLTPLELHRGQDVQVSGWQLLNGQAVSAAALWRACLLTDDCEPVRRRSGRWIARLE